MTYRKFIIALPNKIIVFTSSAAPLSAEFDPFFSILNHINVITMQLLELFNDNLFSFNLDLVMIVIELLLDL
jgi:hypothetical protein